MRCSLINLEETQDEELDAILGELSILESQFQEEINDTSSQGLNGSHSTSQKVVKQASPVASVTSSTGESRSSPTSSETAKKPMTVNGKRTESPDTDSAFCDNLSVLSSCSTSSRYVVRFCAQGHSCEIIFPLVKKAGFCIHVHFPPKFEK